LLESLFSNSQLLSILVGLRATEDQHGTSSSRIVALIIIRVSRVPLLIYLPFGFQNDTLVVSEAFFGKVGHNEAVILTWAIHDPFEHVSISLSFARDQGCSRDGVLEFDQRLSLLLGSC
jgi:hypothetical protein